MGTRPRTCVGKFPVDSYWLGTQPSPPMGFPVHPVAKASPPLPASAMKDRRDTPRLTFCSSFMLRSSSVTAIPPKDVPL